MDKKIRDFPHYRITKSGDVYNDSGIRLKQEKSRNGYMRVSLSNRTTKHKRMLVHRLVADAFIPNPKNLPQINHINENKTDNRVENLEWCTPLNNLKHSGVIEKASEAKFTKIKCITTGRTYNSIKEASDELSLHHSNIVACCNGRRRTSGGMKWEYVCEKETTYD